MNEFSNLNEKPNIENLPNEMLEKILKGEEGKKDIEKEHLSIKDTINLSLTNKRFNEIVKSDHLMKKLIEEKEFIINTNQLNFTTLKLRFFKEGKEIKMLLQSNKMDNQEAKDKSKQYKENKINSGILKFSKEEKSNLSINI